MAQAEHTHTLTWTRTVGDWNDIEYTAKRGTLEFTIIEGTPGQNWKKGSGWTLRIYENDVPCDASYETPYHHYLKDAKRAAEDYCSFFSV